MREILFRGKTKAITGCPYNNGKPDGEWVFGYVFSDLGAMKIRQYGTDRPEYNDYEVDPETVGQYTGLIDKNGKKIFEGDIVRYGDTIHEVIFEQRNGTAYFGLVYSEAETLPFGHYQDLRQIEVIGNIYDTPELLKGAMKPAATDVAQGGLMPATENFSLQEA